MPPKKPAADSASDPELSSSDSPQEKKNERKPAAAPVRKRPSHPTTLIMVKEAIKALDSRKGVSSQAIQAHIKQAYPSVDADRLKNLVRRALIKAQENGTLVRPANSTMTVGAQGKFRLADKLKEAKPKPENKDPNVPKETKKAKDEEKPKKAGAAKDVESSKTKPLEDKKPSKKVIKKEEITTSKVPPVKKTKAKKTLNEGGEETTGSTEAPSTKARKARLTKTSKASTDESSTKATRKRGGKTVE